MSKTIVEKVMCSERRCDWHGMSDEIRRAPNPFEDGTLYACPKCVTIGSVVIACDEPECWKEATCGTPVENGYRRTCWKHIPRAAK